jgi:CDP-paratose 2-epimerase
MKIVITGACGFVGSSVAKALLESSDALEVFGVDNFSRPGSEQNRETLKSIGVRLSHGDIRCASDLELLPDCEWVIDAAANPSVLAGVDRKSSSRQLIEHNLLGTVNLLEYCKRTGAGFILLSTSRVYSIPALCAIPLEAIDRAYRPQLDGSDVTGLSDRGVAENFSTAPPVSLYGSSKLASEHLALEYAATFGFPVWINRCGVLAGAGQFGRADQGIFAFWINSYLRKQPLSYIGFDGSGHQVRDCLHPTDLTRLISKQLKEPGGNRERVQNVSGGMTSAMSLAQLSDWCAARFGPHQVTAAVAPRPFDIPWLVLDASRPAEQWDWKPAVGVAQILEEIAQHAEQHPHWLQISAPL